MAVMLSERVTEMPVRDDRGIALDFLQGRSGVQVRHSGTTLLDHLVGVYDKLKSWDCSPEVCFAGLYHAIYGTENFRQQTVAVADRPLVQQAIGTDAERLAYAFCMLNVRGFIAEVESDLACHGGHLQDSDRMSGADKLDLLHIFVANWLEQMPRMQAIQRSMHTHLFRRIKPLLVSRAQEELELTYGFDTAPVRRLSVTHVADDDRGEAAISVLDDFVPAHLQRSLTALTERNIWRYGWKAAATQNSHHFWHSHMAGDNDDGQTSCEDELHNRPLMAPVLSLWELIRDTLAIGHVPVRVYANGQTYGGDGHLHTDDDRPGHFTSVYYAHAAWNVNWGGETIFFDPAGAEMIKSVYPRPGRLVHFPGNIPHAARSPSRDCPTLRAVFVVKTFCPSLA